MQNITLQNANQLKQRLNNIANINVTSAINKATALVHGQAKDLAPDDTGLLRESIHMSVKNNVGRVYTNLEYAPYVEFGTGIKGNGTYPYKIKGLNLKYKDKGWAYYDEDKDELIFTTGQVAQPYMYRAIKENEKLIKKILKNGVKEHLRANCKGD